MKYVMEKRDRLAAYHVPDLLGQLVTKDSSMCSMMDEPMVTYEPRVTYEVYSPRKIQGVSMHMVLWLQTKQSGLMKFRS